MVKKFLLPFQNMVRADLFSGSLAVWNALGFSIHFARPLISESREAGRGQNSVRANSRIHRQLGKCKFLEDTSRRGTRRSARI